MALLEFTWLRLLRLKSECKFSSDESLSVRPGSSARWEKPACLLCVRCVRGTVSDIVLSLWRLSLLPLLLSLELRRSRQVCPWAKRCLALTVIWCSRRVALSPFAVSALQLSERLRGEHGKEAGVSEEETGKSRVSELDGSEPGCVVHVGGVEGSAEAFFPDEGDWTGSIQGVSRITMQL